MKKQNTYRKMPSEAFLINGKVLRFCPWYREEPFDVQWIPATVHDAESSGCQVYDVKRVPGYMPPADDVSQWPLEIMQKGRRAGEIYYDIPCKWAWNTHNRVYIRPGERPRVDEEQLKQRDWKQTSEEAF